MLWENCVRMFRAFRNYLIREWIMKVPFHFVRRWVIRNSINKLGHHTNFLMRVEIRDGKNITIGNHCVFNKSVLLDGRGGKLIIGNHVDIAQETNIWTLQHDYQDDYHKSTGADVVIEDYVWIASRVTILPGVRIGKGAVIATGSIVTKDVPAMAVMAGVPAKRIGDRYSKLKYSLYFCPWFE